MPRRASPRSGAGAALRVSRGLRYRRSVTTTTETWVLAEEDDEVARVRVVSGPDAGLELAFPERSVVIGSGPAAHLAVKDATVSRLHCELVRERGRIRLRDLGSKNGCFIAGVQVYEAALGPGVRVQLGATTIEVAVGSERRKRARWRGGDGFGAAIGASRTMQDLFAVASQIATLDDPVLIRGESGTGKEVIARAMHEAGPRRGGPFVVLDCAALASSLADVELFGYARGAFTGANSDRAGVFERASGGTLLLDEIGELPFDLQSKLLRAVDAREVRRLGEAVQRKVDVRMIATTHEPLERRVNEGAFREDLLHRLATFELWVPPLRERGRDVALLARAICEEEHPGDTAAAEAVEKEIAARSGHQWPGNVRELRALVRRIVALGGGDVGLPPVPSRLPIVRFDLGFHDAKREWLEAFERQYIVGILDEAGGNVTEAARRSGLSRVHLHELMNKHGLGGR